MNMHIEIIIIFFRNSSHSHLWKTSGLKDRYFVEKKNRVVKADLLQNSLNDAKLFQMNL